MFDSFIKQVQDDYFGRAVNMAADTANQALRRRGFLKLERICLKQWQYFQKLTEEQVSVLAFLIGNHFRMTEKWQQEEVINLYTKSRNSYGKEYKDAKILLEMTHDDVSDKIALELWKGILNWHEKDWMKPFLADIFSPVVKPHEFPFFTFSYISLPNANLLVALDNGQIDFPTPDSRANFRNSCFRHVSMNGATVDHVDFSKSHLVSIKGFGTAGSISSVGTIFDEANLIECYFGEGDFKDASFVGTNISGSGFSQAKNLTKEQFEQGAYWIRPNGPPLLKEQLLKEARPKFPSSFPSGFADTLPNRPPETEG